MNEWKPTEFKGNFPDPKKNEVFFLGGYHNGEVWCFDVLRPVIKTWEPSTKPQCMEESFYRLEKMRTPDGDILFYVHKNEPLYSLLIRSFFDLWAHKKEAQRSSQ